MSGRKRTKRAPAPERRLSVLRNQLLDAQARLRREPSFALAVIFVGVPAAGRSETVNELLEWLDPKYVTVHALGAPDREARQRPRMFRYWRTLPARGRIALYFTGWYEELIAEALRENGKRKREQRLAEQIRQLESMLVADRVRIVKLYLTIDATTQRKRLEQQRANRLTRWRVTEEDLWLAKNHRKVASAARKVIQATENASAPWRVIDGADEHARMLEIARLLRKELEAGFEQAERREQIAWPEESAGANVSAPPATPSRAVSDEQYAIQLELLQGRLALAVRRARFQKHALVLAFEGMDAAGKGGAIRRITHALDARQYRVVPVSAPSPEEAAHPYLWRFWRYAPELGHVTIYDRSWYGRVLVERVRGLTPEADWRRAYEEIREFERQLAEHGSIVVKFWLTVSKDEQLQRLQARDAEPLKRFKVDAEDWANRRFYDAYQIAAEEMIERTDADHAPWIVVPADHKKTARLTVLRTVCDELERTLEAED